MSGRRLLDVAALFNASRGIVRKSWSIRTRQLDVYTRTSSLGKAIRGQTERVTETVKAASFLASRMNEGSPAWSRDNTKAHSDGSESIPSHDSTQAATERAVKPQGGLAEDHFYERSETNSSTDPVPHEDLSIQQEKADRYPLPDGTIPVTGSDINTPEKDKDVVSERPSEASKAPLFDQGDSLQPAASSESTIPIPTSNPKVSFSQHARETQRAFEQQIPSHAADGGSSQGSLSAGHDQDVTYEPSSHEEPVLSSLPRAKIPKQTQDIQGTDEHIKKVGINSDTYTSPSQNSTAPLSSTAAVSDQEEVPEGVNTDLFYSPRVSRMLGAHRYGGDRKKIGMSADQSAPVRETTLTKAKDQDTLNIRDHSEMKLSSAIPDLPSISTSRSADEDVSNLAEDLRTETSSTDSTPAAQLSQQSSYQMRESSVPSSRFSRIWNYGGLAAGMFGGAISESVRRVTGNGGEGSFMLSAGNMDRLVAKLSRMRGAALKLGQMMSFQDSKMLPPQIQQVLMRVQDSADYMPAYQRDKVLAANLGADWRDLFESFEEKPLAAASIGQVHSATLKSGQKVAVKVQYPGVANSIDSDLSNLAILLTASRLLPKGLYLDKTIANARTELAWECDYVREAEAAQRFQELLAGDSTVFTVPKIFPEASGKQVLTMEFMEGKGVTKVQTFTQEQKDYIGTQILRLCLKEITEFKFMQTDPNWTNFLYNAKTNKLELLDFGASREYPEEFITKYTKLLLGASKSDDKVVRQFSIELGYLTGHESAAMLKAHIASVMTLAEPFVESSPEVYDFKDQTITERVKALIPVMIKERLAPPPEETYSLHRKLSGAFLLCAKLGSRVECRDLFVNSMKKAGLA